MNKAIGLTALAAVAIAIEFAEFNVDVTSARRAVGAEHQSPTGDPLAAITSDNLEQRRKGMEALQSEHDIVIAQLISIVERNEEAGRSSPRALAAELLGNWGAISAVPALSSKLDYEVGVFLSTPSRFNMESFPCAAAIAKMGPSALKPLLRELAARDQPLTLQERKIASHLLVSLCDDSQEEAIQAIEKAERELRDSDNLRSIKRYIQGLAEQNSRLKGSRSVKSEIRR